MNDHEVDIRLEERLRAFRIAYSFKDEHEQSYKSKQKAGNDLAFIEEKIADECRLIGNAIMGGNALSNALGYSNEDIIKEEYKHELESTKPTSLNEESISVDQPIRTLSMAIVNTILEAGQVSTEKRQAINDKCDAIIHTTLRNLEFKIREKFYSLIPENEKNKGKSLEYKINDFVSNNRTLNEKNKDLAKEVNFINEHLENTIKAFGSEDVDKMEIMFLQKWTGIADLYSDSSSMTHVYRQMKGELKNLKRQEKP